MRPTTGDPRLCREVGRKTACQRLLATLNMYVKQQIYRPAIGLAAGYRLSSITREVARS